MLIHCAASHEFTVTFVRPTGISRLVSVECRSISGEMSALDSVVRAELLRELHDLVTSKGDPLPDEDHQPRERHLDVKFVAQVARARRRLLRAVCVRRERPLEVSNGEG